MYKIADYSWMMEDEVRSNAYMKALQNTIKPGDVVVDLGAGVGTWAFVCCQLGASKVYAIEVSPGLHVARRIAAANGFSDKVEFIQDLSTAVELPERADVVVFEIHGQQPVFESSLTSILDARRRFLKPGGILLPGRETMWATVVDSAATYKKHTGFWEQPYRGIDMRAGKQFAVAFLYKEQFAREQMLTERFCYADLDYYTLETSEISADFSLTATRGGTGHGLNLWFDSEVAPGIGYSNAPGSPKTIFCSTFVPWPEPVPIEAGDQIHISLGFRSYMGDYLWSCASRITGGANTKAEFSQSSLWDSLPKLNTLTAKR